jgi:Domain of unknown function (DUF4373)
MAKETFWFKHDLNARGDKEMIRVRMKMGMLGIGLYWCIVEMLYEEGGYLLRSEYERIAFELQSKESDVTKLIETYNLFQFDDTRFWSNSALVRISLRATKSKKASDAVTIRWNNERNTNVSELNYETIPIRREEIRKEEIRGEEKVFGVSFSEDKKSVTLNDGTIQELDLDQLRRMKEGNYLPHYVKKAK